MKKNIKKYNLQILIMLLCITIVVSMQFGLINDYDFWFHYKTGEYIFINETVPKIPIYNWYGLENNLQWISHEWLFGLIIYFISNITGVNNTFILAIFICGIIVSLPFLYKINDYKTNLFAMVIMSISCSAVISKFAVPRPQVVLYILTFILFALLLNEKNNKSTKPKKTFYFFPFLTILWVNLHGGSFILVFIFSILYVLLSNFEIRLGRLSTQKKNNQLICKYLIVILISFFCVYLNPHGLDMYYYPISNFTDSVMINSIAEWNAIDMKSVFGLTLAIPMLICIYSLITTKKEIDLFECLSALLFIFLSFRSLRFAAQAAIIISMVCSSYITDNNGGLFFRKKKINDTLYKFIIGTFIVIILPISTVRLLNKKTIIDYSPFPSNDVINKIKDISPERLFNFYDIGGYLMFNDINTFIDGRADIFSRYNMPDYLKIELLSSSTEEMINKYNFDYLLVKNNTKLDVWIRLQLEQKFKEIYSDGHYTIYQNNDYRR